MCSLPWIWCFLVCFRSDVRIATGQSGFACQEIAFCRRLDLIIRSSTPCLSIAASLDRYLSPITATSSSFSARRCPRTGLDRSRTSCQLPVARCLEVRRPFCGHSQQAAPQYCPLPPARVSCRQPCRWRRPCSTTASRALRAAIWPLWWRPWNDSFLNIDFLGIVRLKSDWIDGGENRREILW